MKGREELEEICLEKTFNRGSNLILNYINLICNGKGDARFSI